MSSREEISSTEKLLNVIKGQDSEPGEGLDAGAPEKAPGKQPGRAPRNRGKDERQRRNAPPLLKKGRAAGKHSSVGVSFGLDHLVMVRVGHVSERRWRIMEHRIVPFPVGVNRESPGFPSFLNTILNDFCKGGAPFLWATVTSMSVEIRRLIIPKVARHEITEAVFWTFKKESPFDDSKVIFDFEIEGEVREKGAPRIAVTAYTADKQEAEQLANLFEKAGFPLAGLTAPPFYIQNLYRVGWLPSSKEAVAILYVGDERSRIDIISGDQLVLTRGIKAGIRSMTESVMEGYNENWRLSALQMEEHRKEEFGREVTLDLSSGYAMDGEPAPVQELTLELEPAPREDDQQDDSPPPPPNAVPSFGPKESREPQSLDLELARRLLLWETGEGKPLDSGDPGYGLKTEEVFDFALPAVERLVRQLERTLTHYQNNAGSERVSKILVSGILHSHRPFVEYIGEQLGLASEGMDVWEPGLPFLADVERPVTAAERARTGPALCLALSSNDRTPNFLFTHEQREEKERVARLNRGIVIAFLILIIPVFAFYWHEKSLVEKKSGKVAALESRLASFSPKLDSNLLVYKALEVRKTRQNIVESSRRLLGVAVLNELARITPANVKLLSLTADFQIPEAGRQDAHSAGLVLEGVVLGERSLLESTLATYWMRVGESPMFSGAEVQKSDIEIFHDQGDVLRFFMKLKVA